MAKPVITGDKKLDKKLRHLGDKGVKKVVRAGLGKKLSVIQKGIRAAAPVGETKELKKSIGKRLIKNKKSGKIEGKVGVNVGKKSGKRAPHAHLIALGTADRYHESGKFVGKVEPNDFVQQGTQASIPQAESAFIETCRKKMQEESRKS